MIYRRRLQNYIFWFFIDIFVNFRQQVDDFVLDVFRTIDLESFAFFISDFTKVIIKAAQLLYLADLVTGRVSRVYE